MNKTDWSSYYTKPYKTANLTRKITGRVLIRLMLRHANKQNPIVIELGGADSCFFELIQRRLKPEKYIVIDSNQLGLDRLLDRIDLDESVKVVNADVLTLDIDLKGDLVFSVGLIEHFLTEDTTRAIEAHFRMLCDDGILIMSFPTPTILYRITRWLAEKLGLWIFHDERPLKIKEVAATVERYGSVIERRIVWPIFLTQAFMVARKTTGVPGPEFEPLASSAASD